MSDTARPRPSARRRAPAPVPEEAEAAGSKSTAVADPQEETGAPDPVAPAPAATDDADDAQRPTDAHRPTGDPTDDDLIDEDLTDGGSADDRAPSGRRRISVPLVPALSVLLVGLLALVTVLAWPLLFPEESSVRTDTYVDVLQAARSNVVDLTSFDYVTIDDDIEQARRVTTGDLTEESVAGLERVRQQLIDGQAVSSTEVVGAGVTQATEDEATVVMVIATTRQGAGVPAQVRRDRIEVDLERDGDRWLLSAIRGTGTDE